MTDPRTIFLGYVRSNGTVGVRDYLLALPSVVCATRAAAWAVDDLPGAVNVEHPVGCAQIGADRDQTLRVLVGVGSHPNVRQTAVLGLGCEGVPAQEVANRIRARNCRVEVTTIQAAGGTREAAQRARTVLLESAPTADRQPVSIKRLVLGIGPINQLGEPGRAVVEAYLARGGRVIEIAGPGTPLDYAAAPDVASQRMVTEGTVGANEAITGLVASGAQMILAQCDADNIGGHPVAPVMRIGYEARLQGALADDMDGMIEDRRPDEWVDWILEVASGETTAAEKSGASTFAIRRIGPTL